MIFCPKTITSVRTRMANTQGGSHPRPTQTELEANPTRMIVYKTAPIPPKYPAISILGSRKSDMKIRLANSCPTNKLTFSASASFCGKSAALTLPLEA
jgi:hypothetical protein